MAAVLALVASSTPAPDVLAALPGLADPRSAAGRNIDNPARPVPAWTVAALPARSAAPPVPDLLPPVPAEPRALDTLASDAERGAGELTVRSSEPAAAPAKPKVAPADARPNRPRVVRAAERPARLWAQLRRGLTVKGMASWYWGSRGYAGVAHVAMPGARFLPRGRNAPRARVCVGGRCTVVRVVDACGCHVGTGRARLVDLSATTLHRLGLDPSRGVYRVKVTLIRP